MKRKPSFTSDIGSVSSGTMRSEDLIPTLAGELRRLMKQCRVGRIQRKTITGLLRDCANFDPDPEAIAHHDALLDNLIEALETFAPPYCYFGAHSDDGADYGFWPIVDDDDMPKLVAGDEHRDHWGGDVYLVNDHGNVDCGRFDKRGRFHTYWSVV